MALKHPATLIKNGQIIAERVSFLKACAIAGLTKVHGAGSYAYKQFCAKGKPLYTHDAADNWFAIVPSNSNTQINVTNFYNNGVTKMPLNNAACYIHNAMSEAFECTQQNGQFDPVSQIDVSIIYATNKSYATLVAMWCYEGDKSTALGAARILAEFLTPKDLMGFSLRDIRPSLWELNNFLDRIERANISLAA